MYLTSKMISDCRAVFSPHFLKLSAKQQFIAIADYYGTLHILEIPWTLSHPSTNEVSNFWL